MLGCTPKAMHPKGASAAPAPVDAIELKDGAFVIGRRSFEYPVKFEDIEERLGKPSRKIYRNATNVRIWDAIGIVTTDVFEFESLGIELTIAGSEAKNAYTGTVSFGNSYLTAETTAHQLEELGFERVKTLPFYLVYNGSQSSILAQTRMGKLCFIEHQKKYD